MTRVWRHLLRVVALGVLLGLLLYTGYLALALWP